MRVAEYVKRCNAYAVFAFVFLYLHSLLEVGLCYTEGIEAFKVELLAQSASY